MILTGNFRTRIMDPFHTIVVEFSEDPLKENIGTYHGS